MHLNFILQSIYEIKTIFYISTFHYLTSDFIFYQSDIIQGPHISVKINRFINISGSQHGACLWACLSNILKKIICKVLVLEDHTTYNRVQKKL